MFENCCLLLLFGIVFQIVATGFNWESCSLQSHQPSSLMMHNVFICNIWVQHTHPAPWSLYQAATSPLSWPGIVGGLRVFVLNWPLSVIITFNHSLQILPATSLHWTFISVSHEELIKRVRGLDDVSEKIDNDNPVVGVSSGVTTNVPPDTLQHFSQVRRHLHSPLSRPQSPGSVLLEERWCSCGSRAWQVWLAPRRRRRRRCWRL